MCASINNKKGMGGRVTQSFERLSRSATLALLVAIAPNRSAGLWNWPCIVLFPSSAIKWKFISLREVDGRISLLLMEPPTVRDSLR